ncbi:hypothetical protein KM043_011825 [Ampulex compressa]|nr:hypothetical protein KM043_011825 [Ampulex compressa]
MVTLVNVVNVDRRDNEARFGGPAMDRRTVTGKMQEQQYRYYRATGPASRGEFRGFPVDPTVRAYDDRSLLLFAGRTPANFRVIYLRSDVTEGGQRLTINVPRIRTAEIEWTTTDVVFSLHPHPPRGSSGVDFAEFFVVLNAL